MSSFQQSKRQLKMDPKSIERREKARIDYTNNKDKINAYRRRKYKENPEYYIGLTQKWKEKNPEWHKLHQREYRKTHPNAPNGNVSRNSKMWNAQNKAIKMGSLAKFCELCPEDDVRLANQRHHPDYDYPLIFVSTCQACHSAVTFSKTVHAHLTEEKQ